MKALRRVVDRGTPSNQAATRTRLSPAAAQILAEVPYDLAEGLVDELKRRFGAEDR